MRIALLVAASAALGMTGAASATSVVVNASLHGTFSVFNSVDFSAADANFSSPNVNMRTNVFDGQGNRQPWIKFTGVDAALAAAGKTKADVVGARVELTVSNFDTEVGVYEWSLFGINDGVTNEDFTLTTRWDQLPGVIAANPPLPGQVPVYTSQDPTESALFDSFQRTLLPGGARPQTGQVDVMNVPASYIQADTNDVLSFMFHQTSGENSGFRPFWFGTGAAAASQPRLVLIVPEPATLGLLAGLGLLGVARRR